MSDKKLHMVFDWNGTLLDDVDVCLEGMNLLLKREGIPPLNLTRYREIFTFPVRHYYEKTGLPIDDNHFESYSHLFVDYYERHTHRTRLFSDVRPVLKRLKKAGISCSVLSAYPQEKLEKMITGFHLEHFFEHIMGLDNIYADGKSTQAAKLYTLIAAANDEIWFVGDTVHDYEVGAAMNATVILVPRGHQDSARLKRTNAHVIPTLDQLTALMGLD